MHLFADLAKTPVCERARHSAEENNAKVRNDLSLDFFG